jgi:hypothetical protein
VFRRFFEADSKEAKLAAFRVIALDRGPAIDPITRAFRAAAAVDPEIATAFEEYERRRWTDMSALVGAFGTLLRPHLTVERATDVLWSVFAGDTGDRLTGYRGWTEEEYVDWMIDALDRLVLR